MIPYGRQTITDEDEKAVVLALHSERLTCGPEVDAFEEEFAEYVGAEHAVAVANATDALHLAMRVAGIGRGDRVVTSPNTFLSSANCAAFVGATPDFSDIEPVGYNLDPGILESGWKEDTRAVVAVDYAGQPANMPEIARVARERGAVVIEDACHGTGGGFQHGGSSWKLGGHPWADITTFSFHPVKTMTTGEGGILVTDNDDYAAKARLLRTHGMERDPTRFHGFGTSDPVLEEPGPWVYEMQDLGYNCRITDLQCALGRSQLRRLPAFVERRREIVAHYNEALADCPWITTPSLAPWLESDAEAASRISWHLYTVRIDFESLERTRTEVMRELMSKGVGSQVLYIPVYLQPWYRETYEYVSGKCPVAEAFYREALSLPLFPSMSEGEVETVAEAVRCLNR